MINRFSPKETAALRALARYKFLTYEQMKMLKIGKHRPNLSKVMNGLSEVKRPYVRKIPNRPATPVKFYLTKKGKDALIQLYDCDPETILLPKTIIYTDTQDQKHRTSIISIQIAFDLACLEQRMPMLFCLRYFDSTGNNRIDKNLKSRTAFHFTDTQTVKADLIFAIQTAKQKELYILELENGKDTQKGIEKCINHAKALFRGSVNQKFDFQKGYRTLWVFEHKSIMFKVMEGLQQMPLFDTIREYFLFKPLEETSTAIFSDWLNVSGDHKNLYYID